MDLPYFSMIRRLNSSLNSFTLLNLFVIDLPLSKFRFLFYHQIFFFTNFFLQYMEYPQYSHIYGFYTIL